MLLPSLSKAQDFYLHPICIVYNSENASFAEYFNSVLNDYRARIGGNLPYPISLSMKEYNRYSKGLFSFVGFRTKWLEYENVQRVAGETKWSFWKLFKYAIEGIVCFFIFCTCFIFS